LIDPGVRPDKSILGYILRNLSVTDCPVHIVQNRLMQLHKEISERILIARLRAPGSRDEIFFRHTVRFLSQTPPLER
jgi:hypothetical protein